MNDKISLKRNQDFTYDVVINFRRDEEEFAFDFFGRNHEGEKTKDSKLIDFIRENAGKVTIRQIRILIGGTLIGTMALANFLQVQSASVSMGYLYTGTDAQQIEYVNRTKNSVNTVAPSYFDIYDNSVLYIKDVSKELINNMHAKGIKVTPFLSNHWDRQAGIDFLRDYEAHATKLAAAIKEYNLDGINIDIENVTHNEKELYTNFVKSLRKKLPADKVVSVAIAANPKGWTLGWQGSYDYKQLAEYADYLILMAYDEHYQYGDAGPVASYGWVEDSIKYALNYVPSNKLVLGIPFYGRIWSSDNAFQGTGVDLAFLNTLISTYNGTVSFDTTQRCPKVEFTIKKGDPANALLGQTLKPASYTIWYENNQSIKEKMSFVHKYQLEGVASWALGKELVSIWDNYSVWLNNVSMTEPIKGSNDTKEDVKGLSEDTVASPNPIATTSPNATPNISKITADRTGTVINANALNVRSAPSMDGKIIATLAKGAKVSIISKTKNWYRITLSNGRIGYVYAKYVKEVTQTKVTTKAINVYTKASITSKKLGKIVKGTKVAVLGTSGTFTRTTYKGKAAYVKTAYLK